MAHRARVVSIDRTSKARLSPASAVGRAPQGEPHRMAYESDGTRDQPTFEETHMWNLRRCSHGQPPDAALGHTVVPWQMGGPTPPSSS
jgi:hypothetical protein